MLPAIKAATTMRAKRPWVLKTDIRSFFDRIPRPELKDRVRIALGNHSLVPLIKNVIDCEIKDDAPASRAKLEELGIRRGRGLRQGMPLSPVLSNLILAKFDKSLEKSRVEAIRYADDLIVFCEDEARCRGALDLIEHELAKLEFEIPSLTEGVKTEIVRPKDPVEFLGREIKYSAASDTYINCISRRQLGAIRERLVENHRRSSYIKFQKNIQDLVCDLSLSVRSYYGLYKDVHNFSHFDSQMRGIARSIISGVFEEMFGSESLSKLNEDDRQFLGINDLIEFEPLDDLPF